MGQFKALSYKNWILWKRNTCGNITQIIIPIMFIALNILIRIIIQPQYYPQASNINDPSQNRIIYGQQSTEPGTWRNLNLRGCPPEMIVALTPAGNPIITQIHSKLTTMNYNITQYASQDQIFKKIRSPGYGTTIPVFCFGISIVQSNSNSSYVYKIMFNTTSDSMSQIPPTNVDLKLDKVSDINLYFSSLNFGSISTVTFVNNIILQKQTGVNIDVFKNLMGPIYQQQYYDDGIYTNTKQNVAIFLLLPLLLLYLRQTSVMLAEKQTKIRQTMSIMGMSKPIYYITWFIRYFVPYLIIHIIGAFIMSNTWTHAPFIICLILFILFDIVLILQSFFIQIFFTKSRIGVVIGLLFFLMQYIISFVSSNSNNPSLQINRYIAISPHAAYVMAFQLLLYAESVKKVATFMEVLNNYQIFTSIISLGCNIIFWLIVTWYLQQVVPNQFGSKKHPLFFLMNENSNTNKIQDGVQNISSETIINEKQNISTQFQEVDQKFKQQQKQKTIIQIQNLKKQFNDGQLIAVNNLCVKMYKDNIFVLLGHNGAGKTTTISMLTGMLQSTSGKIQVMGETSMEKIREKIGVCPQHDTLYEDLTVKEHLQLFGTFRGLNNQQLEQQVNKLINDVNLFQKSDQYSKNLSGGQKRRLSVAMAFAGRSNVIILDQPTSGMDTSSRRYIWQLLKVYKSDRIILLTTHFMDQADYLGDRIGIMAGGQLICCGSGHFLKNRYGVGYNITFVKKNSKTLTQQIFKIMKKHIQKVAILSDVSAEVTMQLPLQDIKKFPDLLNEIDSKKDSLSIATYGISITTLQEVFLKVGSKIQQSNDIKIQQQNEKNLTIPKQLPKQLAQMSLKNMKYKRISKQSSSPSPNKNFMRNSSILTNIAIDPQSQQKIQRIESSCSRFWIHLKATILKRLRVIKRDYKSFILQILLPMGIIIAALFLMTISFIADMPQRQLSFDTFNTVSKPLSIPIGSTNVTFLNNIESKLNSKYGSKISVIKDLNSLTVADFDSNFLRNKKKSSQFLLGGLYFLDKAIQNSDNIYQFTTVVNTQIPTSYLYLPNLAAQIYLNQLTNQQVSIKVIQSPFPKTYSQMEINNSISGFFGSLVFSIALAFKFSSIVALIVKEREDKSKHQQIVSGMNIYSYWIGNFIYDYTLYALLAAFSVIMCYVLKADTFIGEAFGVTIIAFFIYGVSFIPFTYIMAFFFKDYGNAQAGYYFFTFVSGGLLPIIILVLRLISQDTRKVGQYLVWILRLLPSFCFGEILMNLGSINFLSLVELDDTQKYNPWDSKISLFPIFCLIGQYVLYTLLLFIIESISNNENFMRFWTSENKIMDNQLVQDTDVIQMQQKALKANPQKYQILTKNLRKVYMLDSKKKYKVAVDNLSLAIQKGQVFGLLGVNGAGKTTTFKMLAGQLTSTSGDSYFIGLKISENLHKIRQNLGYCPQFDALIQNLTVRQQIQLFYDLKSLPSQFKQKLVDQKIKQMDLTKYEHKLSGTLSGGNKRKLSVAMAMIGNPSIIFLDQPSTGMDPKARRFMWKIISNIASQKKQSTIILTTHSMQEAQALSTKLGIMVNGQFKCIGTPQHIKSKYGAGYQLQIKLIPTSRDQIKNYVIKAKLQTKTTIKDKQLQGFLKYLNVDQQIKNQIQKDRSGSYIYYQFQTKKKVQTLQIIEFIFLFEKISRIKRWMKEKFGQIQLIQNLETFLRFKVNTQLSVGKIFQILQNQKDKVQIQSYSIKQATVQQIFNKFAQDGQLSEKMG